MLSVSLTRPECNEAPLCMTCGVSSAASYRGASLSAQFAMVISPASAVSAGHRGGEPQAAETGELLAVWPGPGSGRTCSGSCAGRA